MYFFLILGHSSTYIDYMFRRYNGNTSWCADEYIICTSKPSVMLQRCICSFLGDNLVGPNMQKIDLWKTRDWRVILAQWCSTEHYTVHKQYIQNSVHQQQRPTSKTIVTSQIALNNIAQAANLQILYTMQFTTPANVFDFKF